MVDRRDVASWLEGPNAQRPGAETDYPGRRLGMPEAGPGSVGRFGRRLVAILIDWTLCQLIAYAFTGAGFGRGQSGSWWPLLVAPLCIRATTRLVILPEEDYLADRFGQDYQRYSTRVRRWV